MRDDLTMVVVILFALLGALLTSYVRARAEHVIDKCTVGFFERGERFVFILIALLSHNLPTVLWCLAVFSNVAALQRLAHTALALREKKTGTPVEDRPLIVRFLLWDFPRRGPLYVAAVVLFALVAAVPAAVLRG